MLKKQLDLESTEYQYNVTELSNSLKKLVERNFAFVKVKGEISGFKAAPSGHAYFSLKDQNSLLASVCWRGTLGKMNINPEDGLEVICTGSITTYPGQSKYQLVVEKLEHAGTGALMALLAKRKETLEKEGLFRSEIKKKIPIFPKIIGIVTSPTGAVIKDILHRLNDRMPTHVVLWPVLVQGDKAANQIAKAIDGFNNLDVRPDIIIVARGGGSIEDLWAFNEEIVVRAVFNSTIPVISAIGHETDTTLIDYASDLRAPTPTAAAEMAVPVKTELLLRLDNIARFLNNDLNNILLFNKQKLDILSRSLPNLNNMVLNTEQRIDDLSVRLKTAIFGIIIHKQYVTDKLSNIRHPKYILDAYEKDLQVLSDRTNSCFNNSLHFKEEIVKNIDLLLKSLNYQNVLARGFSIIRDEKNKIIDSKKKINQVESFNIEFIDGIKIINNFDNKDNCNEY